MVDLSYGITSLLFLLILIQVSGFCAFPDRVLSRVLFVVGLCVLSLVYGLPAVPDAEGVPDHRFIVFLKKRTRHPSRRDTYLALFHPRVVGIFSGHPRW